jgi:hypothetical protein
MNNMITEQAFKIGDMTEERHWNFEKSKHPKFDATISVDDLTAPDLFIAHIDFKNRIAAFPFRSGDQHVYVSVPENIIYEIKNRLAAK